MKTGEPGRHLIIYWESEDHSMKPSLKTYVCPAGHSTIALGNTTYENGGIVKLGDEITEERGWELFENILLKFEKAVKELVKVPLNQNEFDALVSFVWNTGYGNLSGGNTIRLLNEGKKEEFLEWHAKWIHDNNHKVLPGLVTRRKQEAELFLKPVEENIEESLKQKETT